MDLMPGAWIYCQEHGFDVRSIELVPGALISRQEHKTHHPENYPPQKQTTQGVISSRIKQPKKLSSPEADNPRVIFPRIREPKELSVPEASNPRSYLSEKQTTQGVIFPATNMPWCWACQRKSKLSSTIPLEQQPPQYLDTVPLPCAMMLGLFEEE